MTLNQLKEMNRREYALWFANAKANDLKEVLNNENLGGGISKFTKAMLIEVVMDLVDGVETELTKQLKPKRSPKEVVEEIRMYKEMMKKSNATDLIFIDMNRCGEYTQANYFMSTDEDNAKKKYLRLVKYYHPDKATGDDVKFKNIQAAWETYKLFLESNKEFGGICEW